MSNVSIFDRKWIDLVFEGKNKEYGAYELRKNSSKTTLLAFFCSLGSIATIVGITTLFSSHTPNLDPIEPIHTDSIISVSVEPIIDREEPVIKSSEPSGPKVDLTNKKLVVVKQSQATDSVYINSELPKKPVISNPNGGDGNGTNLNNNSGGGGTTVTVTIPEPKSIDNPEIAPDKMPEFPGGINKFYSKVANSFEQLDIENVESLSVIVSFVVERDGSMTDIKILRNPGYGVDKAAIKVLQNMKTKWKPGIKNGNPVRTQYTLPITVNLNE